MKPKKLNELVPVDTFKTLKQVMGNNFMGENISPRVKIYWMNCEIMVIVI
jgi:hypothetical protein